MPARWERLGNTVLGAMAVSAVLWFWSRSKQAAEQPPAEHERCQVLSSPRWRPRLAGLAELDLRGCDLPALPAEIGLCTGLKKLDLGGNPRLVDLPAELALCTQLEILFVLGCRQMTAVPEVLGRMTKLTRLGLRSNGISQIGPHSLPAGVVHLILTDNKLEWIQPAVFDRLTKVRKLMLANNLLTGLPADGVRKMVSLELIRLANNQLKQLPAELLQLPKLAWFAAAGNPCMPPAPPPVVPDQLGPDDYSVDLGAAALGQGASGKVLPGQFNGKPVAIKTFKAVSSDGKAEDEAALYAAVGGASPFIIRAVGVARHPDGQIKVLMEQLPGHMLDLALPPTIVEVTTDRWLVKGFDRPIEPAAALRVLSGVCAALGRLHSLNLAHGDVYGHNIKASLDGKMVKLGDFGAAFCYGAQGPIDGSLVERVEVRAFGVLASEMAALVQQQQPRQALVELADRCDQPAVSMRPGFAEIAAELARISQQHRLD